MKVTLFADYKHSSYKVTQWPQTGIMIFYYRMAVVCLFKHQSLIELSKFILDSIPMQNVVENV